MRFKTVNNVITVAFIAVICCLSFFAYNHFVNRYETTVYPRQYEEVVSKAAEEFSVPEYIIYAVIRTESLFKADAVSPKDAVGLMQLTPDTFNWLLSKTGEKLTSDKLYDPTTNISYGTRFLSMLYEEFGDWEIVYAGYNAGMNRVRKWLLDPELSNGKELLQIPFKETREYVERVAETAEIYKRLYYSK